MGRSRRTARAAPAAGPERLTAAALRRGVRELSGRDPDLGAVVREHGEPPLWAREPGFRTLLLIILEQQVSLASARAAMTRLEDAIGPATPDAFLPLSDAALHGFGFSRQKRRYGRELARRVLGGRLDLEALAGRSDSEVRARLTEVRGIGPWTADIYLLMALGRPDVWPSGDLALATAVRSLKRLPTRPAVDELKRIAEGWAPWRAVAARILWHYYLSDPAARARSAPAEP